jgi:hypothetical protein
MRLVPKSFSVNLPWGIGGVSMDVSEEAERAAWMLYVELNTRIATKPLERGEGSVREALTSLYNLFGITRMVLKEAGVDVAKARKGKQSLGTIAMSFLNDVVRPSLVAWHTSLSAHEAATWKRMIESGKPLPNNMALATALVDETSWEGYDTFHAELQELQDQLRKYVAILGSLAGAAESHDVTQAAED